MLLINTIKTQQKYQIDYQVQIIIYKSHLIFVCHIANNFADEYKN